MHKKVSYHAYLIESLKNHKEATAYCKDVLEEGNVNMIQKATNTLIEAVIVIL